MQIESLWTIIILSIISIILFTYLFLQNRKINSLLEHDNQPIELMASWLQDIRSSLSQNTDLMFRQLDSTNKFVAQRVDHASNLLQSLNQDIGKIHQISQQIQNFEYLLRAPHLRGQVGERILIDLLNQTFPQSHLKFQHKFRNNSKVDALIITSNGNIPIDSKFPMENFIKYQNESEKEKQEQNKKIFFRDIARHIENIAQKYINPSEGTTDFAIMYIPSEKIYYEIITNEKLVLYSEKMNILLVSPNNFYYFLKIILLGLEGERIEEKTTLILQEFNAFEQSLNQAEKELEILTTHMNNAQKSGDRLYQIFIKIDKKVKEVKNWTS